METNRVGGSALVAGFSVTVFVLYRNPVSGADAATDGVATVASVILLPVAGFPAGVYACADGPPGVVPLFLLGMFGLGLILVSVLGSTPIGLPLGIGVVLLSLSLGALVTGVLRTTASVQPGFLRSPSR